MREELTVSQLEEKFHESFQTLDGNPSDKLLISIFLGPLKNIYVPEYMHCLRVGIKCKQIGEFTNTIDPMTLFRAGTFHDIGKKAIRKELLQKNSGWTKQDAKEMDKHSEHGASMIRDIHEFEYWTILNHHAFNHHNKSKLLYNPKYNDRQNLLVFECARLVNLADFYDSATYKKNDRNSPGEIRYLSDEEVKSVLLHENSDKEYLIRKLYEKEIF